MSEQKAHTLPGTDDVLQVVLANGVTVLARENFTSPSVVVNGLIPGGALLDPRGKAGLSSFHSALLMRGSRQHSFDEIYEAIESNGASLEFGSGGHTYRFAGKSLAEDLPLLLNLSAEILREPIFSAEHVERVRGQILTSLQLRAHNTGKMANLTFHELAYPEDHPYAFSVSGYEDTVSGIRREDIIAFHNNLGPRGAIIVVVGAVKAEQAVEQVRAAFQSWSVDDQPPFPVAPPAPRLKSIREAYVPIPGKSQVDIVMGFPGPERSAPSYHAARIANSILGVFGMYGRLGEIVRRQQGLAYYSYSNLVGGFGPGPWQLIAGVAPDSVDRVVSSFRDEIRRLVDEPVAGEELADNKAFFIGQLVLGLETNEGVASVLMTIEKHQLGLDYLYGYADMINALTVQDVQNVAATYLDPDAYALAIAGSV